MHPHFFKMTFIEQHLFPCAYKSIFGIDCPMCGFQRSLILLLNGNLKISFETYPPLLPTLFLIIFFALHLFSKKFIKRDFLICYSAIVLIIITINYVANVLF